MAEREEGKKKQRAKALSLSCSRNSRSARTSVGADERARERTVADCARKFSARRRGDRVTRNLRSRYAAKSRRRPVVGDGAAARGASSSNRDSIYACLKEESLSPRITRRNRKLEREFFTADYRDVAENQLRSFPLHCVTHTQMFFKFMI